jgi:S-adenosylmethionine/arginine decarboxylase-like enzyme
MPNADALAYGMHLVYDGGHADPSRLADGGLIARMVRRVATVLAADEGVHDPVLVEEASGVSAGVALTESSVSIHAFPGLATLCLDVFSVQRRQAESLYLPIEGAFAIGRSTSRRANRARAPRPGDPATLARRLSGERAYAEARFTDLDRVARG